MELKGIKEFLERYKKTLLRGDISREEIILLISDVSGVTLKNSEFKIDRGTVVIQTTSIKKNQIFLYREAIIKKLKTNTTQHIIDIH